MSAYRDKVLGFGIGGGPSTRTVPVEGEHKPVAGQLTEHRDGRVDATVFPDAVSLVNKEQ